MKRMFSGVRQPVKRERAEHYLLLMLVSFAVSVVGTRWYLELTGYPQIGGGGLHIAHVLWGGLLLFAAALLPLILANRDVYTFGALLGGAGVGLFIDEVGKFITSRNDYFYPPAAPIIYAFFLLTVLIYVQVRREPSRDARAELYRALDALEEVLDHDLEPDEREEQMARLRLIAERTDQPELARLARALLDFLASDAVHLVSDEPRFWERQRMRALAWEERWLPRIRLRLLLGGAFALAGLSGLFALGLATALLLVPSVAAALPASFGPIGPVRYPIVASSSLTTGLIYLSLLAAAGLPLLVAAVCLLVGRERVGVTIGYFGLLISLTVINLMLFYFEQFQAAAGAIYSFVLLLITIHYRRRYLGRSLVANPPAAPAEPPPTVTH
jgi:hypothetical protein